jgi:hypothetical protein
VQQRRADARERLLRAVRLAAVLEVTRVHALQQACRR